MTKNIFVVGQDDFNLGFLQSSGEKKAYAFHSLLSVQEVKRRARYDPEELLRKAESRLKEFEGTGTPQLASHSGFSEGGIDGGGHQR